MKMTPYKLLIYDQSKAYARLLKVNLNEDCGVFHLTLRRKLYEIELSRFNEAFVIVNTNEDLADMLHIYTKIKCMYVGTDKDSIAGIITLFEGVTVIDLQKKKKELKVHLLEKVFYSYLKD